MRVLPDDTGKIHREIRPRRTLLHVITHAAPDCRGRRKYDGVRKLVLPVSAELLVCQTTATAAVAIIFLWPSAPSRVESVQSRGRKVLPLRRSLHDVQRCARLSASEISAQPYSALRKVIPRARLARPARSPRRYPRAGPRQPRRQSLSPWDCQGPCAGTERGSANGSPPRPGAIPGPSHSRIQSVAMCTPRLPFCT